MYQVFETREDLARPGSLPDDRGQGDRRRLLARASRQPTCAGSIDQTVTVSFQGQLRQWVQALLAEVGETLAAHDGTAGILRDQAPAPLDGRGGVDAVVAPTSRLRTSCGHTSFGIAPCSYHEITGMSAPASARAVELSLPVATAMIRAPLA